MNVDIMIESICAEIKQILGDFCEREDLSELTPALAERMSGGLMRALSAGGVAAYRAFLLQYEHQGDTLERDGCLMRLKSTSPKCFLVPFGEMVLPRKIYQADRGGKCFVPLDAAWGMEGEFASMEVQDATLFSCGLSTPVETETLFKKCALFHPSSTAIKHIVEKVGSFIEEHADSIRALVHEEERPPEGVESLAVSADGVNTRLRERGVKQGRPGEQPGMVGEKEQPTAYKNAMVGSVSFYGAVPDGHKTPERLESRYVARMPEERAPTFKSHLEAEVAHAEGLAPAGTIKVLLLDAARSLWSYAENAPAFADYEKAVDYFHTAEHLSLAGEALFGKTSSAAKAWYEKYREKLLSEDGAPLAVLRSIDYYIETRELKGNARKDALAQRIFFARNKHRMPYADFRRRGLPIGSGVVEAACKSLVKTRLCRSGMRWSRRGGQHILNLRVHIKSGRWEQMWGAYKQLANAA